MIRRLAADLHMAAAFLTRLPVPRLPPEPPPLARAMWAFPLIGAAVGLVGGTVLATAGLLGLPSLAAALLAVAATVLLTGALHEDGLADIADGFGGGTSRERKLTILRDSRIGAYGTLALILSVGLRTVALAGFTLHHDAVAALVAAAALGRAAVPLTMRIVGPARRDGLGAGAGRPHGGVVVTALGLGGGVATWLLPAAAVPLFVLTVAVSLGMGLLAHRQIGGYTGDVLGATAQIVEVAALLLLLAML